MLDVECFSFLNRALENELSPLVIMASNRGMSRVRGTKIMSPHGLPVDLLDRVLIVSTKPYTEEDIEEIIKIRSVSNTKYPVPACTNSPSTVERNSCEEEDVVLSSDALKILTSMGQQTTLRYALNLISCAHVVATKRKAEQVDTDDLRRAYTYFMDEKRSVQWMEEQQGSLLFEEADGPDSKAPANRMDEN